MRSFAIESGVQVVEYLYSQVKHAVKSATVASGTVTAAANGDKVLNKGVVLAVITSGEQAGKYGPFDDAALDGRQTSTNIVGVNDSFVNLKDGDKEVGLTYRGVVRADKVTVVEGGEAVALNEAAAEANVLNAFQASGTDITVVDPTA